MYRLLVLLLLSMMLLTSCTSSSSSSTTPGHATVVVTATPEPTPTPEIYTSTFLKDKKPVYPSEVYLPLGSKVIKFRLSKDIHVVRLHSSTMLLEQKNKYFSVKAFKATGIKDAIKQIDFYDIKPKRTAKDTWKFSSQYEGAEGFIRQLDAQTFIVAYSKSYKEVKSLLNVTAPVLLPKSRWEEQTISLVVNIGIVVDPKDFRLVSIEGDTATFKEPKTKATVIMAIQSEDSALSDRDSAYGLLAQCCEEVSKANGELAAANDYNVYRYVFDDELHRSAYLHVRAEKKLTRSQQASLQEKLSKVVVYRGGAK